jgi:hypothetical protein
MAATRSNSAAYKDVVLIILATTAVTVPHSQAARHQPRPSASSVSVPSSAPMAPSASIVSGTWPWLSYITVTDSRPPSACFGELGVVFLLFLIGHRALLRAPHPHEEAWCSASARLQIVLTMTVIGLRRLVGRPSSVAAAIIIGGALALVLHGHGGRAPRGAEAQAVQCFQRPHHIRCPADAGSGGHSAPVSHRCTVDQWQEGSVAPRPRHGDAARAWWPSLVVVAGGTTHAAARC